METFDNSADCEPGSLSKDVRFEQLVRVLKQQSPERQRELLDTLEVVEVADLADVLREAIDNSGCSRYWIAEQSGVGADVLSRFMSGERDIRLATAAKIADVLELELRTRNRRKRSH